MHFWRIFCFNQYSFYETNVAARKLGPESPIASVLRRLQEIKNLNNLRELEGFLKMDGQKEAWLDKKLPQPFETAGFGKSS